MLPVIRSGMTAAMNDLSVTSNNIANARTTGFKKRETNFADVYITTDSMIASNRLGSGVRALEIRVAGSQGNLKQTGDILDLAIEGEGLFTLLNDKSNDALMYTRDGSFTIDSDSEISTPDGYKLLSSLNVPIRIPPRASSVITENGVERLDEIALTE